MTTGADGYGLKLIMQDALPFDNTATAFELSAAGESLAGNNSIINTQGMAGTRSQRSERSRTSITVVSGTLNFEMSPLMMVYLLPKILGGTPTGTSFPLAETLPAFQCQIDRISKVFNYTGLVVNKATFKGSPGGFVQLALDVVGVDEVVVAAGGGQAIAAPLDPPFIFEDGVLTVAATGYNMLDFELTIDNKVAARNANSLTATRISPTDLREIGLSFTCPWGSGETALYNSALAGLACSLVFTNGGYSATFTLPCVQFPRMTPVVGSKGEIPMRMQGICRMTSTTKEIVIVNDSSA